MRQEKEDGGQEGRGCVMCPATTAAMCARGRREDGAYVGRKRTGVRRGAAAQEGSLPGGWCAERCSVAMEPPGLKITALFTRVERGRCGWSCHGGHSSPPCHGRVPVPPSVTFTREIGDDCSSAAGPLETNLRICYRDSALWLEPQDTRRDS